MNRKTIVRRGDIFMADLARDPLSNRPSTALCERILTIEKTCLINRMGTVAGTKEERLLDYALMVSLGLK